MDLRKARLERDLAGVDLFLAPTRFARERALESGLPAERVRVLPLGAVPGPIRRREAARRRRLAYVGTLLPHKGLHVLIEAMRRLESSDASLDVHGNPGVDPRYAGSLRALAAADPRIRWRGGFAEGGHEAALAAADLLVVPSIWWENSPLTILEALAAGVPVVASAIGGVPELLEEGVTGRLVPPGDAVALGAALREVVIGRSLCDGAPPAPVKTVTEGARELIETYRA